MLQIVGDSAAIQVAIHSAFQPGFSARSLWRAWRGNMFARSTFNIVAAECRKAFLYGESCGGYKKKKMKVTRMGTGKVRSPYNIPLEGKTLAAIARHARANWKRSRPSMRVSLRNK